MRDGCKDHKRRELRKIVNAQYGSINRIGYSKDTHIIFHFLLGLLLTDGTATKDSKIVVCSQTLFEGMNMLHFIKQKIGATFAVYQQNGIDLQTGKELDRKRIMYDEEGCPKYEYNSYPTAKVIITHPNIYKHLKQV